MKRLLTDEQVINAYSMYTIDSLSTIEISKIFKPKKIGK